MEILTCVWPVVNGTTQFLVFTQQSAAMHLINTQNLAAWSTLKKRAVAFIIEWGN